jgi:hypothetical protein
VGALVGAYQAYQNGGDWWKSAITGGLGAGFGYFAPVGIFPGLVYGSASGSAIGAIQAALFGADTGKGALAGGLVGMGLGGFYGGIRAANIGANLWSGKIIHVDNSALTFTNCLPSGNENTDLSDEKLHSVAKDEFDFEVGKYRVKELTAQKAPPGFVRKGGNLVNTKTGETVRGATAYNPNFKTSRIYIALNTMKHMIGLKSTIGHELIHAYHYHLGLYELFGSNFTILTENVAHSWQAEFLADYVTDSFVHDLFARKVYGAIVPGGRYYLPYHLNHFRAYFKIPF